MDQPVVPFADRLAGPASDVEAFAALQGPLVAGYALDALGSEVDVAAAPSLEDARDFVGLLLASRAHPAAAVGLGTGLCLEFGGLVGTGLAAECELVSLTAFADDAPRAC